MTSRRFKLISADLKKLRQINLHIIYYKRSTPRKISSLLLFNLFINDLPDFLNEKEIRGIAIDGEKNITTIFYTDDLVILVDSSRMVQKALNALAKYCQLNDLEVNKNKTKIMVFRQGGKLSRKGYNFTLNKEKIKIVNEYDYLGAIFSSSGLFKKAALKAVQKAGVASDMITDVIIKSKLQAWEAKTLLFNCMVSSTLLYGAEIWSLRHLQELEKIETNFCKRIFNWPKCTPNYILRKETDFKPIALSRFLSWLIKLQSMEDSSLPKIYYKRLQ